MTSDTRLLFVYGTLKRGNRFHDAIAEGNFIGEAITDRSFFLVQGSGFPSLVLPAEESVLAMPVIGELFEIDESLVRGLDYIEGYPDLFSRSEFIVKTKEGIYEATIYYRRGSAPDAKLAETAELLGIKGFLWSPERY